MATSARTGIPVKADTRAVVMAAKTIAFLMLQRAPTFLRNITRPIGIVFVAVGILQIFHIFSIWQRDSSVHDYFNSDLSEVIYLLAWLVILIFMAFSIILMYNKRLIIDINIQEEKFSKAFHAAPFITLLSKLEDGEVFEVNNSVETIADYKPNELIGYKTTDLNIWKDDNDRNLAISELKAKGKIFEKEYQFRKKSGELFTGLLSANTIEINKELCIISVITDITERKLAQHKFQMLFEKSPIGMALVDHETGEFLEVNNSVLESTGYTKEEFLKLDYWDITPKAYEAQEIKQLETLNETGHFGPNFKEYIRKDGSRYPLSISGSLFIDTDGRKVVWGIIEDISERKEKEVIIKKQNEELQKLNATKDKFFSIIAHDLKNPFSAIIGFSNVLLKKIKNKDIEAIDEYAQIINHSSKNALALLTNLMEWSRSQTGRMEFNPTYFDIQPIVNEAVLLMKGNADQKSIAISNTVLPGIPVNADKAMLSTVLRNLISNAIKFTQPNGEITIASTVKEHELIISVTDNGVGISENQLDKIFQLDKIYSTLGTQKEKGTGLGLILCKEFVEKNNGKIWVESTVNKGTTFYFSLPLDEGKGLS